MTADQRRGQAHLLGLLLQGYSPEEVECMLEGALPWPDERTALTDPTNVLMQEVSQDDTADSARSR